jgi:hypothetical protein
MDDIEPFDDRRSRHLFAVGSGRDPYRRLLPPDSYGSDEAWALSQRADLFTDLIDAVGGAEALARLDAVALPDEPFDWSAVDTRDVAFVTDVLAAADKCCELLLDIEFRTIARRILARVAVRGPAALRRSTNVPRCAAGLVWLAGRANAEFGTRCRLPARLLWRWFGVADASDRGRSLRRAAGLEPDHGLRSWDSAPTLGDPELLHSRYRKELVARRDLLVGIASAGRRWSASSDGTAHLRSHPVKPVLAAKGLCGNRAMIVAGFGDDLDDATFYSFNITDARELLRMLQDALDAPMPRSAASAPDGSA